MRRIRSESSAAWTPSRKRPSKRHRRAGPGRAARTRNWFLETDLVIARLDKLSRDEELQQKLQAPDAGWDLVLCDEAHKLSASSLSLVKISNESWNLR